MQQGDTVTAYGLYPQAQQHGFFFSLASFVANLFHPASPPPPGLDAGRRQNLPLLQVGLSAGLASIPQLSGGVPQGYLRLLIFNCDSALVDQRIQQLTQVARGGYEPLRLQVVLPQDGYVTAYVGTESDVDVFFDDVTVEHRPGLHVQEVHYDAAGLELAGLAPPAPGIRGLNNYRFNGQEFQADLGLNWNHQDWRLLDPTILRWNGVDPELENGQESWTPYSFGYDNAVRYADANGRAPEGQGPGKPDPNVVGRIYQHQPNMAEKISNVVNNSLVMATTPGLGIVYNTANMLYTFATGYGHPDQARTLEGHGASRHEYQMAAFGSVMLIGGEAMGGAAGAARSVETVAGETRALSVATSPKGDTVWLE